MKTKTAVTLGSAVALCLSLDALAQMRELPKEGLEAEGITQDIVRYEPENQFRRANALGQTSPAPKGTKPGSTDPQNIAGVWLVAPTYSINADGSYTDVEQAMGMGGAPGGGPGGGMGAGAPSGAPGGAPGAAPAGGMSAGGASGITGGPGNGDGSIPGVGNQGKFACKPGSTFAFGMPMRIMQVGNMVYFLTDGQRAAANRRIELNGKHPANLTPSYTGHSVGRWEGEWLVIDTVGLKGSMSTGMFGGGGSQFSSATRVTERLRKTDGNMLLEKFVTIEDPSLKEPFKQRLTAYYRPDMDVHEAPCEEYSDPFDGKYVTTPFEGNTDDVNGGVPTEADLERLRERERQQQQGSK
jgi:hypothetical protein